MQVQFFKCTLIKHYWIIFYRLMEWNNIGLVLKNKGKNYWSHEGKNYSWAIFENHIFVVEIKSKVIATAQWSKFSL